MKVLAVDPGYERVGIAVVERNPGGKDTLVHSECFQTLKESPFPKRLRDVGERVEVVIKKHEPDCCALEGLFFNSNQKTAMRIAEVRGMLLYMAEQSGLFLYEYTPLQVKIAITGYGRADKAQVMDMVRRLIAVPDRAVLDDEFDAIAVGLTCLASEKIL